MSSDLRKKLFSLSAAAVLCAALQSGIVSGQILSSSGGDNNTRFLLRATDSSIAMWVLDPNLDNLGYNHYYSAATGWEPLCIGTGSDNYTRLLWKNTDGSISIWVLDPYLNYVSGKYFGPAPGWNPITLSVKKNGDTSVLWKRTDGLLAMWLLNGNLDWIQNKQFGPFPVFDPGANAMAPKGGAAQSIKIEGDTLNPLSENGRN
jgi:hypothetical protein